MSYDTFKKIGFKYMKHSSKKSEKVGLRRFKCFFGVTPHTCSLIWSLLSIPLESQPKHLLWSLYFLKQYDAESIRRTLFHVDEKTIRKWTWIFVTLISDLNVVTATLSIFLLIMNKNIIIFDIKVILITNYCVKFSKLFYIFEGKMGKSIFGCSCRTNLFLFN